MQQNEKASQDKKNQFDALISKDVIHRLLRSLVGNPAYFKPNDQFYKRAGINCRRWAKLYRGELSITLDELSRLCSCLEVKFNAETFAKQLTLFDND